MDGGAVGGGFSESEANDIYIRQDGTSITDATISFISGITVSGLTSLKNLIVTGSTVFNSGIYITAENWGSFGDESTPGESLRIYSNVSVDGMFHIQPNAVTSNDLIISGIPTFFTDTVSTSGISLNAGSLNNLPVFFSADSDTGFYRPAANQFAVALAGSQMLFVGITNLQTASTRFRPALDNTTDLGQNTLRWKDFYVAGSISDGTTNTFIGSIVTTDIAQTITGIKKFNNSTFLGGTIGSSPITIGQSLSMPIKVVTSAYGVGSLDFAILGSAAGGIGFTITLPNVAQSYGRIYYFKKIDAGIGIVTIDGSGGDTIDGATTVSLATQNSAETIIAHSGGWFALSSI